ncbi:hypothetical protein RFI_12755, partial [Reticulomyxa filosa]
DDDDDDDDDNDDENIDESEDGEEQVGNHIIVKIDKNPKIKKLTDKEMMEWLDFDTNYMEPSTSDKIYVQFERSIGQKYLTWSLRQSIFELLPPEFRIQKHQSSILSEIKPGRDLYFYMFVVELLQVFYLLFLYNFMAEPSGNASFNTSRFSGDMVLWLFIQVLFLVFDRVVYLIRSIPGKLILQIVSVIVYHWQVFIVWPRQKNQLFTDVPALVVFYLLKIVYWILSAIQIRYGYPTFDRTHSRMAKEHSNLYYIFFSVYASIPFILKCELF